MPRRRNTERLVAIGKRVKALRADRGLSQAQLAEAVGVEPMTISRFENGRAGMGLSNLLKLAEALRAPLSAILDVTQPAAPGGEASPGAGYADRRREEWLAVWDGMSEEERKVASRVVRVVFPPRRKARPTLP